jgi:nucleotide-binding universal stress UspA family protein
MNAPVVVGFDGSVSARAAVQYGVGEALLRGCGLRLVHAFSWPLIYPPFGAVYDPDDHGPRVAMLNLLQAAASDVRRQHPDLSVDYRIVDGSPGGVLVKASSDAAVLVVGHRGLGGFTGLLAGSVGMQVTGHAHCPVVVVRGEPVTPGPVAAAPIVLGFDGSPSAGTAAVAAFAQAQRREVELFVVHQHAPHTARVKAEAAAAGHSPPPCTADELAASLRVTAARYSDVKYHTEVVHGDSAATALITAAHRVRAGLLVVGTRGVGGFRGLVMGSTSRGLVEHASCPIMVVPPGVHPA